MMSEDDFKAEQQKESLAWFNIPLKRVTTFHLLRILKGSSLYKTKV
jgi:hypothetical protein